MPNPLVHAGSARLTHGTLRPAILLATCMLLASCALSARANASPRPAFGDSGWVAPLPVADTLTLEDPPSRVAEKDHEPVGETVLRTPFRLVFLPVRLAARGLEGLAGVAGDRLYRPHPTTFEPWKIAVTPLITQSGSAGLGVGAGLSTNADPNGNVRLSMAGTWSRRDHRRVRGAIDIGKAEPLGLRLSGGYGYRPNYKFYGVGNFSQQDDRSIYLREFGDVLVTGLYGKRIDRRLNVSVGWSNVSARKGYNDSPGVLDVFAADEFPYLLNGSTTWTMGAGGDLAFLDRPVDPTRGVHFRAQAQHNADTGDAGVRYWFTKVEARGYLPVFSKRRVLVVRAFHEMAAPTGGSSPIPFYRLAESTDDVRFAAYPAHRFVDHHLALARLEYRWVVVDRLWMFGLAEVGEVAPAWSALRYADVHESYGGGFRYSLSPSTVARVQVAGGSEGLYLAIVFKEDY